MDRLSANLFNCRTVPLKNSRSHRFTGNYKSIRTCLNNMKTPGMYRYCTVGAIQRRLTFQTFLIVSLVKGAGAIYRQAVHETSLYCYERHHPKSERSRQLNI